MSDQEIDKLESEIPPLAAVAFTAARERALASGHSVLESEQGFIYEVFPDGRREMVKKIAPPTLVVPGTKIVLR